MPEHVYGYPIRSERLLRRAEEKFGVVPGQDGIQLSDILLSSFINLAVEAGVYGKVLLYHTEFKGKTEKIMALASNNARDVLPTHPSLPDPSDVERLQAVLSTKTPPRWYRTC